MGSAGESTDRLLEKGISNLAMVDGPQGVRISPLYYEDERGYRFYGEGCKEYNWVKMFSEHVPPEQLRFPTPPTDGVHKIKKIEQYCTAIPIGMALAQSFNIALCEAVGALVGEEMELFGARVWLAPALNIHRDPLCGRNFEYYSEDPLLSGKIAAAIIRGTQDHPGCAVTIKHFACNNQETNRMYNNSKLSERALRDIYLRGFEIAVKEGHPHCVMSSYNLINGTHSSERSDLLDTVLRQEWGFDGIVISDWVVRLPLKQEHRYPAASTPKTLMAGNDLFMPGSQTDYDTVIAALRDQEHPLTREHLEKNAARIINLIWKLEGGNNESLVE